MHPMFKCSKIALTIHINAWENEARKKLMRKKTNQEKWKTTWIDISLCEFDISLIKEATAFWFVWLLRKMLLTRDLFDWNACALELWCEQICHFNRNRYSSTISRQYLNEPHLSWVAHTRFIMILYTEPKAKRRKKRSERHIRHSHSNANPVSCSNALQFIHRVNAFETLKRAIIAQSSQTVESEWKRAPFW